MPLARSNVVLASQQQHLNLVTGLTGIPLCEAAATHCDFKSRRAMSRQQVERSAFEEAKVCDLIKRHAASI
jgi:hypothetical protein